MSETDFETPLADGEWYADPDDLLSQREAFTRFGNGVPVCRVRLVPATPPAGEAVAERIRNGLGDAADDSAVEVAKVDGAGFEYTCQLCSVAELRDLLAHPPRAPEGEAVAWAVVKDGGPVTNGHIWADRATAERFVRNERSYAMQQPRLGYDIIPLYAHPPRATVTFDVCEECGGPLIDGSGRDFSRFRTPRKDDR